MVKKKRKESQHGKILVISKLILVVTIALLFAINLLYSAGTTAEFLDVGISVRQTAMFHASGSIFNDISNLSFNPAKFAHVYHPQISLAYTAGLVNTHYGLFGIAYPTRNIGTLAISMNYLDYGEIEGRTVSGHRTNTFTASDRMMVFSFGNRLLENLSFGFNIKLFEARIMNYNAGGLAFDLGILYCIPQSRLVIAHTIRNLGSSIKFIKEEIPLPTQYIVGIAMNPFEGLPTIAMDMVLSNGNKRSLNLSIEYSIYRILSLRLCLSPQNKSQHTGFDWGYGFGVQYRNFLLDYIMMPHGILGETHRVSLSMKFGGK